MGQLLSLLLCASMLFDVFLTGRLLGWQGWAGGWAGAVGGFGALGGVQWTNLDFLGGKTPEAGFKGCLSAAWISRSSNLSPSLSDMFSQTGICICTYGWYGLAVFHQENLLLDPSVLIPG